ncbi:MAG: hypothetical protein DAHOPDDO_00789 [Ignavibacteriaceae bacterium]|nr:hypothetical protein [Ignavibacteriaceae bacterium]
METYLKMLVAEQIHRCRKLEELIKYPIKPAELYTLSERCKSLLKVLEDELNTQFKNLELASEKEQLRTIYIEYKTIRREIDIIENYGIAILKMKCDDLEYLNKLVSAIHSESRIPLQIASVASFSSEFYFFAHKTNVIFMPAADHTSILNLPILYHELGHYISRNRNDSRLKNINISYQKCVNTFTTHYAEELKLRLLGNAPLPIKERPIIMLEKWKGWIEEFFSDCVATILCGPAYAWTWLHTTAKISANPIFYDDQITLSHPSDEARFRICKYCLEEGSFIEDIKRLDKQWSKLFQIEGRTLDSVYQQAYPDSLMRQLAKEIIKAMKSDNFNVISQDTLENDHTLKIVRALNEGWNVFWNSPNTFFEHENQIIKEIEKNL